MVSVSSSLIKDIRFELDPRHTTLLNLLRGRVLSPIWFSQLEGYLVYTKKIHNQVFATPDSRDIWFILKKYINKRLELLIFIIITRIQQHINYGVSSFSSSSQQHRNLSLLTTPYFHHHHINT